MVVNQQWSAPSLEQVSEMVQGILPREFHSWDEVPGRSAQMQPTPLSRDAKGVMPGANRQGSAGLEATIKDLLPTPCATDTATAGRHVARKIKSPNVGSVRITSLSAVADQYGRTGTMSPDLIGGSTSRPSDGTSPSSGGTPLPPPTTEDACAPDSWSG